jgi:hypothetical protein
MLKKMTQLTVELPFLDTKQPSLLLNYQLLGTRRPRLMLKNNLYWQNEPVYCQITILRTKLLNLLFNTI